MVSGGGSELYGVEPWTYYFKNLFLNFNCIFVLALTSPMALLLTTGARRGKRAGLRLLGLAKYGMAPVFLWLGFMTMQPHKEVSESGPGCNSRAPLVPD